MSDRASRDLFVLAVERDVLADLSKMHLIDEAVFNKLAEHTDYDTGQIGFKNKISVGGVASELTETLARKASSKLIKLSRADCRRSIDRLVAAGLFERHSISDNVTKRLQLVRVFWRNFVPVCHSAKNPDVTLDVTVVSNSIKQLSYLIKDLNDFKKVIHNPDVTADVTQDKTNNNNSDLQRKFLMTSQYAFDDDFVKRVLQELGFDSSLIDKRWTVGFKFHWVCEGVELNFNQWHYKYCKQMMRYLTTPTLFDELMGWSGNDAKPKLASVKALIPAVPRADGALSAFASKHDFREAKVGESTNDFRKYLIGERMKRLDRKESEAVSNRGDM